MAAIDEDALVCDFAQFYHLNFFEQPVDYAAILARGLPAESRIQRVIRKKVETERIEKEEFEKKNAKTTINNEIIFDSPEEFEKARAKFFEV